MTAFLQRLLSIFIVALTLSGAGLVLATGAHSQGADTKAAAAALGNDDAAISAKSAQAGATGLNNDGGGKANISAKTNATLSKAKPIAPKLTLAKDIAQPLTLLIERIDNAKKAIERLKNDDKRLANQRDLLADIPSAAVRLRNLISPRLDEVITLAAELGPPPTKDQSAETPTLAATRAKLSARRALLDSAVKETRLIETRAAQLIGDIQTKRQKLFTDNLLRRTTPPLSAGYWRDLDLEWPAVSNQLYRVFDTWFDNAKVNGWSLLLLILIAVGLGVYMWRLAQEMIVARLSERSKDQASFVERCKLIAWVLPTRLLPYGVSLAIIMIGLSMFDMLSPPVGHIILAAAKALIIIILVSALSRTILAPRHANWRLIDLNTPTVTRLYVLLLAIAAVYGINIILSEAARVLFQPVTLRIFETFVTSTVLALLLITIALLPLERADQTGDRSDTNGGDSAPADSGDSGSADHTAQRIAAGLEAGQLPAGGGQSSMQRGAATQLSSTSKSGPIIDLAALQVLGLRTILLILAATILITTLSGYVALGGFVARQVVLSGGIISLGILLHLAIRSYTQDLAIAGTNTTSSLKLAGKFKQFQTRTLARGLFILLNIALLIALTPWLLLQWGFNGTDIINGVKTSLFGFDVGGVRISIARIVAGVALFTAIVFATKLFQRWLEGTMSARASIDPGVANSIRAVVGYTGMTVAALSAVSYAGFDISKFAIVAGALSVGIGFGLQSIVNNFVSGLILLAERPIKVGDWIVVGNEQGHVRRISVRATEIETFDKASVIIPNSELIAGQVINWTHRNKLGRAVVAVGVGYHCDPERVRDLLLEIGAAHPKAMKFPAPVVHFDNLGASSLDFSLRVYIADINSRAGVQTELRMAIIKAFRLHNIEIPFQQHDIHLRDLDGVKQVLTQVIAERNKTRAKVVDDE